MSARPRHALVDHFEHGLDAPICLTWELTYACNLACVHCLSSSGRRDPRELTHRRVQGGDRRARSGCRSSTSTSAAASRPCAGTSGSCVDYATAHDVGVKFSTNGSRITPERAARLAASDYVDVQISIDGATRRGQRRGPRPRLLRDGDHGDGAPAAAGLRAASRSRSSSPARTSGSSTSSRRSPTATARSCGSRGCAPRAAAPTSGTSCTRPPRSSATLYDWLLGARRGGADRRLVLPPRRLRRVAARAEPLRRRARRLPDRPGRRRLRLPVRDPRRVPRRQRARAARLRRRLARVGAVRASCASRSPAARCGSCGFYDACRGGCMAAKFFTGLPLDGPDPECVLGHGERLLAARGADAPIPRPSVDHSRRRPPRALRRGPAGRASGARPRLAGSTDGEHARTGSSRSPRPSGGRSKRLPSSVYWRAASPAPSAASRSTTTSPPSASSASCRGSRPGSPAARELATTVMGQDDRRCRC